MWREICNAFRGKETAEFIKDIEEADHHRAMGVVSSQNGGGSVLIAQEKVVTAKELDIHFGR